MFAGAVQLAEGVVVRLSVDTVQRSFVASESMLPALEMTMELDVAP
jgi:hypothetical protein